MFRNIVYSTFAIAAIVFSYSASAQDAQTNTKDWARWRGPTGNAIAPADQKPPTKWSATENVIWKSKVPGTGHASPIILGDKIFLATAELEKQSQSVVCLDRKTGDQLWQKVVNQGGFPEKIYPKNTHASPTVATDGTHVFAVFNHHGAVEVTKLDLDGKIIWKKNVGNYDPVYKFGFGASPIVHNGKIIVTTESKVDSGIYAYDLKTGDQIWKINRNDVSSYSTPVVANVAGKEQLLISGKGVKSYDPKTGSKNWETPTDWQVSCGTMVWDGDRVFISGGYPAQQTLAIDASNGKLVWENNVKSYEQSLLAMDGHIYAHSDGGVLYCWRAADGQEKWKSRFSSGRKSPVSVSPVLANGNIYFTAENGETVVVKLDPNEFKEVARNKLGDKAFATPAFCDNRIYTRVGDTSTGSDHQWLYCLGKK